ncbi:vp91/p95 [Catopsilia pomona nucleopolyhedrovirus]|uniref:Vp91/p95 n=1 Tax=Catopsilia pomona nucleopolyhedrovirus TaxID=1850906 RepID=A0A172WZC3_9ABAC|nr:vp91/p95 [Catopsilia pomona nucleopolyhedrovirus]ANF29707.1 vp91/p95 [Catopsilia pomona nucleopolyhedrovirus]
MSAVVLLMLAIFFVIAFILLYLAIFFEFDETTFTKRLQTLTEYARRTNADKPTPDVIGYVSDIYENTYIVTWFKTNDLSTYHESVHDDRLEIFNFIAQKFQQVDDRVAIENRVAANVDDPNEFIIVGDDGNITMKCPQNFNFDYNQLRCVPVAPCHDRPPGQYAMDERMLDTLVLNQHLDKDYSANAHMYHPTLYLRCLADGNYVVNECPDNYTFDALLGQCRLNEICENRPNGYILDYFPETLLVNQFMQCVDNQHVVSTCPQSNQVFDRNLMSCVEAHPCAFNGAGHTYITADIGESQFFKCLNNSQAQLVTCINRIRNADNQYECSGNSKCVDLPNGTGRRVYEHVDDNIQYNSGQMICDNFKIISEIECDQTNVLANELFLNKFKINLQFPAQVFDGTGCAIATADNVNVLKPIFAIENIPNHYNIDMQTSMVGKSEMLKHLLPLNVNNDNGDDNSGGKRIDNDSIFAQWLLFAKENNAVGLNPFTGEPIDCFGDRLYDVIDASRANICNETGTSVVKTVHFTEGQFLAVLNDNLTKRDDDYKHFCAISDENGEKIVKNNHFVARILTNILQSDVCADLYTTLYQKYTTPAPKYTTPALQYNYTLVKRLKNIERYGTNTRFENATISKNARNVTPLFNPFQKQSKNNINDIVEPTFNPFATTIVDNDNDDNMSEISEPDDNDDDNDINIPLPSSDVESEPEEILPSSPLSPPPSPLILDNKDLFYSCYYSVPFFKLTSCHAENDIIKTALENLRANVQYDADCEPAKNLSHVLNAYAYIGSGIGCRSMYENDTIKVKKESIPSQVYLNLETQSNDNVKYNRWVHVKNEQYMACPEDLYDADTFQCAVEPDKLYYLNNMQEE